MLEYCYVHTLGENLNTESATSRLNRRSVFVSSSNISDGTYNKQCIMQQSGWGWIMISMTNK